MFLIFLQYVTISTELSILVKLLTSTSLDIYPINVLTLRTAAMMNTALH